jgi:hypothetical protein
LYHRRKYPLPLRTQTPTIPDLPGLFSLVISQSVRFGGWDLIGGGIVDLAFLLLDTPPQLGGKITPRIAAQHRLGRCCVCPDPISEENFLIQVDLDLD